MKYMDYVCHLRELLLKFYDLCLDVFTSQLFLNSLLYLKSSLRYSRCWVLALIRFKVLEIDKSWRQLISLDSRLLRNLNLTVWSKGWVVIPSLSVMKEYNRHMKGFPKMTLSVIFLIRINVVLKHMLS